MCEALGSEGLDRRMFPVMRVWGAKGERGSNAVGELARGWIFCLSVFRGRSFVLISNEKPLKEMCVHVYQFSKFVEIWDFIFKTF